MGIEERELYPERSSRDFFGAEMRFHRKDASLSVGGLAEVVRYSKTHISNIETGTRTPPPDLPGLLDRALPKARGIFTRLYPLVETEGVADWARRYKELEPEANAHDTYATVVPGLWQTEEYALAQFRLGSPRATEEELRDLWEIRKQRQAILSRTHPPFVWTVLNEVAVRQMVGGPSVMKRQVEGLVDVADGRNAHVQILPLERSHGALGGPLTILNFDDGPRVAYCEGFRCGRLVEKPKEVSNLALVYDQLRTFALSPDESLAWLKRTSKEYRE
ncbi:helix-turn-helix domain-containing protein [Kitasatospora sp. NPDC058965]|uniref:helix-turn-helix domain-containing protein n=1 Tax=Kitasatospora sp. NPDC058965 TaxID=3346682 RepID=UPI0036CAAEB0